MGEVALAATLGEARVVLEAAGLLCGLAVIVLLALQRVQVARFRASQKLLRDSEERLRFALEATNELVWDWNLAEDTIYHPRWAQFYGYPDAVTPRNSAEMGKFMHPDDGRAFGEQVHDVEAGKRESLEIEHRI